MNYENRGELSISGSSARYVCYRNIHAGSNWELQSHNFDSKSKILSELNDELENREIVAVELYVRSQYPGWANRIRHAKVAVKWGLNDFENLLASRAGSAIRSGAFCPELSDSSNPVEIQVHK